MQNDIATPPQFKGFFAIITTDAGVRHACKVINEGTAQGGTVPVWKVRPLRYAGAVGWSGGCRSVYVQGEPQFVRKSMVSGSWKTDRGALKAL